MRKIRVFYAHPSSMQQPEIGQKCLAIREHITDKWERNENAPPVKVSVTPGRADFQRYFNGDWDEWTNGVSKRGNATTGERLYHFVITTDLWVGRATASIVQRAMSTGMPAFHFSEEGLTKIAQVRMEDPDDWQAGFLLETPPPTPALEQNHD